MAIFLGVAERLKDSLNRKANLVKSLKDQEFFVELLNYLEFIVTEPLLGRIFYKLDKIKEQDLKNVRALRSKLKKICLEKRAALQKILKSKGLIDSTVQYEFDEYDKYRSGSVRSTSPLEDSLSFHLHRVIEHVARTQPGIKKIEKFVVRDKNGTILRTVLADTENKLEEAEDELELRKKHAVWMSWDRLLTMSYVAYGYRKDWEKLKKKKHFLELMGVSLLISEFKKAIASTSPAFGTGPGYFKRNEYEIDLLRLHNFILDELDKEIVGLSLIEKFRRMVEWYLSNEYKEICMKKNENELIRKISAFLFEHNVFPVSRPLFGRAEPDILAEVPVDRIPIEVKKFGTKDGIAKLHKGVAQTYEYVRTLGQSFGHFIVFNYSQRVVSYPPQIEHGDIVIHIHVIDVTRIPPSKRKLRPIRIRPDCLEKYLKGGTA